MRTIKSCLVLALAVFAAAELRAVTESESKRSYAAEPVASFYGFATPTNGTYTATASGGAIRFTSDTTWDGNATGLSVLVRYSDYEKPDANAFLVTLRSSVVSSGADNGIGVFAQSSDGTVHGVWNNGTWTDNDKDAKKVQVCDKTVGKEEGYLVLTYKGGAGTILYDADGTVLYQSSALMSSTGGQQVGGLVTVGSASAKMTVAGVRLFKGVLAADEIAAAVADYEADGAHDSISVNVIGGNSKRPGKSITSGAAGVYEIGYENWNQLAERSDNTAFSLTTKVVREVLKDGTAVDTPLTLTLSGKCAYTCGKNGSTPNGALLFGYIDDGNYNSTGRGAGVEVAGIPYSEYTLYVYFGSDGDGGSDGFGPIQVNGTWYPAQGTGWGNRATARTADPVLTEGQNYIAVAGLTSSDLAIFGSTSGSPTGTRCGIAGFQIVNTGVRKESGVTGLHISSIDPKPKGFDPNGHESSVVYLTNYGPEPANLKDYKIVRTNYGKEVKYADTVKKGKVTPAVRPLLDHVVVPGETYAVYLSEDYETAEDFGGDGVSVRMFGEAMVVPTKVNPKKYPMVRLYAFAAETNVIDEVIVPCEIDDGITVEVGLNTNKLVRYVANGAARTEIGPEVNAPYGTKDAATDIALMNARGGFVPTTNDLVITLPVNPLKTGDRVLEPNRIAAVTLEYRFFDKDAMTVLTRPMTKGATPDAVYGDQWTATIPQAELAGQEGKLLQYRAVIADNGGATWTAPRFCHPELGYQWYGAVVQPAADTRLADLPTMLMFADSVNLGQMDKDADSQDKSKVPYNARIAIYDTSTHAYYDNVRIDLRGNTSKGFKKKSHGLRFGKVAPFATTNPLDGTKHEVRKTSFCAEYADPTYIRQSLSFWLLNKVGARAPFHYPVRLYLNGAFYQLAFHSERFTDELIEDVYGLNKYVYSYKNIGTFGGGTSAGGIEKKTPDDDNEKDLALLNAYCGRLGDAAQAHTSMTDAQRAAITKTVVTNFDLSAWINYLAVARITHENDDVWANLSGYIDKYDALHNPNGNDLMAPLAYDMNLSWGQWYYGDDSAAGRCGLRPAADAFKSHPLYGGFTVRAHKVSGSTVGNGNRAVEAVWQNDKFRRLYLRRLRTLMDEWLKEPGTPKEATPFWAQYVEPFKALITASGKDVDEDRAKWDYAHVTATASAVWVWNSSLGLEDGYDDLWDNYVEPRRLHLFGKHSVTNEALATGYGADLKAGIPAKQSAVADLKAKIGYSLVEGGIKITNANDETVDISGWRLAGPFAATVPCGTVLDAQGGEVYFVTNRIAYCAANAAALTDQFIVGNVAAGVAGSDVTLKTAAGEDVIAPKTQSEQEKYLRLWGFCGVPDATKTDEGEFIIFTNLSQTASLDAGGADIRFEKAGEVKGRCFVTLPAGTVIAPGGWVRFNQADVPWEKITNGKLDITLRSSDAIVIYGTNTLDQTALGVDGTGYCAVYDFAKEAWGKMPIADAPGHEEPDPPTPPPGGGVISGEFPDGLTTNVAAGAVLRIGNATFGKALAISGADATIELQEGTTATIPKIETKKALTIGGTGTLVMSNDTQLIACAGLTVTNGTVRILYTGSVAESKAVELKGGYVQYGGTVTMDLVSSAEVYGFWMDTKKMEVKILGGTFNTTVDGGAKSATFRLEKGSNNVTLGGGTVNVTLKGDAPRFVQTKAKIDLAGATVKIGGSAPDARVFKSVETLKVSGGVITGEATGDGSEIFSADDDIKVTGGVVSVTAGDDCFSAQTNIVISAGKVQALSVGDDAIDSNGDVTISGGDVFATTRFSGGYGIEADGAFVVTGGRVVAVGGAGVIHVPDAGSVACYAEANIATLKKYLVLTSDYLDRIEKLSVNLKSGEKRNADGFSLVAYVPNMYGGYGETDTKPSEDKPKGKKLDDNLDGVFVTVMEKTPVAPGEEPEMKSKTKEDAEREIKTYKVELTDEDKAAGVPQDALKMEAVAVTNEVGTVTGYKAVVALNSEVVEEPSVGGDQAIEITPVSGGTEVSVGIVNATKGLWYGYEVCNALGDGFVNDVPSFNRATGPSITVTGSKREGASSFFRVKVLPSRPAK